MRAAAVLCVAALALLLVGCNEPPNTDPRKGYVYMHGTDHDADYETCQGTTLLIRVQGFPDQRTDASPKCQP